jgi:spore coat protein A, manganese oxidase
LLISRRDFLQKSGVIGATLATLGAKSVFSALNARPALDPNALARFVDPVPLPRIARSIGYHPIPIDPKIKVPRYRIEMRQFESKLHRDLKPTRQWGYGSSVPGPTIETHSGQGLVVEWVNSLPPEHFLPIDHNLHGAERSNPEVRAVVHLHGGKTPPDSDGFPENWIIPGHSAFFYYPNNQDAAMLWYHDHAVGINRLNIFAGLIGVFIIRDEIEAGLNLPGGKYEIPLVINDRMFDKDGQLYYPLSGNPDSPWITEFFGDTMLVNGKIFPYLEVEPRKYRFRVLNGANARFFHISLANRQSFYQIGTDLGLLPSPIQIDNLLLAPAERADLIVDFSGKDGQLITMNSDTFDLMQFRVLHSGAKDVSTIPAKLRPIARIAESESVRTRTLSLMERDNLVGKAMMMLLNGTRWSMPITERPVLDTVEIWSFVNVTDDAHPIHLHLVRFQILDRRRFDVFSYRALKTLRYTGPAIPPEPNEAGWKDTVRANPGMVTRIIVRFEGYTGRYVWHCHLLEHEDNEMMRPYEVITAAEAKRQALETPATRVYPIAPSEWCVDGRYVSLPER